MNEMMQYIIIIMASIGVSAACAFTRKGFASDVFLCALIVCIGILIWQDMIPFYMITVTILMVMVLLFGGRGETHDE